MPRTRIYGIVDNHRIIAGSREDWDTFAEQYLNDPLPLTGLRPVRPRTLDPMIAGIGKGTRDDPIVFIEVIHAGPFELYFIE